MEVAAEEGEGKYLVQLTCCDIRYDISAEMCNTKIHKKGKKKVKNLCPVTCEPFKTFKFGKKNNKEMFVCGDIDSDMCEKKSIKKKCKTTCDQCPSAEPLLSCYSFVQGKSSGYNDIERYWFQGITLDEMKSHCDANEECLGFNSNGWMKNYLRPDNEWIHWTDDPNKGFYIKN